MKMKKNITEHFSLYKLNKIANGDEDFVREMIVLFLEKAPEAITLFSNLYSSLSDKIVFLSFSS